MTVFERTYDAVWPFGQWCAVAMAMKRCGLRSASGPFDWMGGGCPLGAYINMLTTNFAGFFLKENMKKLGDKLGVNRQSGVPKRQCPRENKIDYRSHPHYNAEAAASIR